MMIFLVSDNPDPTVSRRYLPSVYWIGVGVINLSLKA